MEKLKTGQVKLYPPRMMWRILSERRYTVTDCIRELKLAKVRVNRRSLYNWFSLPDDTIPQRWPDAEAVLVRMVGR